ncbi:EAL domain-containing protein [Parasalinivibrio latis]|uniref:EAL domain-containing protein n=1 Tax=Parasalinivibrio latis TaxID=2952610 RepID=UPI0030E2EFB2
MIRISSTALAVIISALIFVITYVISHRMVTAQIVNEITIEAGEILNDFDSAYRNIEIIFSNLSDMGIRVCNEKARHKIRKLILISSYTKDAGFISENSTLCSAENGWIPYQIVKNKKPDIITEDGYQIWKEFNYDILGNTISSTIIKLGDYVIALDSNAVRNLIDRKYQWRIMLKSNSKLVHFAGINKFELQSDDGSEFSLLSIPQFNYMSCVNQGNICLVTKRNLSHFDSSGKFSNPFIFLLCLLVSTYFYLLIRNRIHVDDTNEERVRSAIKNNNFSCVYEPIVDLKTKKVVGVELLSRLNDRYGNLSPCEFIPIISQIDMTWEFTKAMMIKSLNELSGIKGARENFMININIFPKDLSKNELVVLDELECVKRFRGNIILEVIESECLEDEKAMDSVAILKEKGIFVAIDDFGTGYSNFNQLRKIKSKILKIDRVFVMDIKEGAVKSSLLNNIVTIAKQHQLDVIAEGIETKEQVNALEELGVEYGQGWILGKPMNIGALDKHLSLNG